MSPPAKNVDVSRFVWKCIYCHTTDLPLTDEHIVPFALGGTSELRKACCPDCQEKVHQYETESTSKILGPLRHGRGFKSRPARRAKGLPKGAYVTMRSPDGQTRRQFVVAADLPKASWKLPYYSYPPRLEQPTDVWGYDRVRTIVDHRDPQDAADQIKRYGATFELECDEDAFCRFLVRLGYTVAFSALDFDWEPFVRDYLRGGALPGPVEDYIGHATRWSLLHGEAQKPRTNNPVSVYVTFAPSGEEGWVLVIANVHILPNLRSLQNLQGVPQYGVVLGKCTEEKARSIH